MSTWSIASGVTGMAITSAGACSRGLRPRRRAWGIQRDVEPLIRHSPWGVDVVVQITVKEVNSATGAGHDRQQERG
jgi:hypothetical protein